MNNTNVGNMPYYPNQGQYVQPWDNYRSQDMVYSLQMYSGKPFYVSQPYRNQQQNMMQPYGNHKQFLQQFGLFDKRPMHEQLEVLWDKNQKLRNDGSIWNPNTNVSLWSPVVTTADLTFKQLNFTAQEDTFGSPASPTSQGAAGGLSIGFEKDDLSGIINDQGTLIFNEKALHAE